MASVEDLYAVSRRLCFDVTEGLSKLERDEGRGHGVNDGLAREMLSLIHISEPTRPY